MTLHLVNKSAQSSRSLAECIALLSAGSAVLLIEDAVYAALDLPANRERLQGILERGCRCFALIDDIRARGISKRIMPDIVIVDYKGFVGLSLDYPKVMTWG